MDSLKRLFTEKDFVITAEISPPKGTDISSFQRKALFLKEIVDAVNVTDNQRSIMRMSPLVPCLTLLRLGIQPVFQITCRDRNRMALQSDLLGAWALGIRNVLVLTGDSITAGDHREAKPIFDLDSVQLLKILSGMNEGFDANGNPLKGRTDFFLGATVNPNSNPLEPQLNKFFKKIRAGAKFFQTQAVFDLRRYERFYREVEQSGAKIIVGILVLKSAKMARFVNQEVPGVKIPEEFIREMEAAPDPSEKGIEIAVRLIKELKGFCHGTHIMSMGSEERIREVIERAEIG